MVLGKLALNSWAPNCRTSDSPSPTLSGAQLSGSQFAQNHVHTCTQSYLSNKNYRGYLQELQVQQALKFKYTMGTRRIYADGCVTGSRGSSVTSALPFTSTSCIQRCTAPPSVLHFIGQKWAKLLLPAGLKITSRAAAAGCSKGRQQGLFPHVGDPTENLCTFR